MMKHSIYLSGGCSECQCPVYRSWGAEKADICEFENAGKSYTGVHLVFDSDKLTIDRLLTIFSLSVSDEPDKDAIVLCEDNISLIQLAKHFNEYFDFSKVKPISIVYSPVTVQTAAAVG